MSDGKIIYDVDINDEGIESKVQQTNSKVKNSADTGSSAFGEVWTGALRRIGAGLVELGAKAVETGKQVAMDALDQVASLEQNIGGIQKLFGDSYQSVVDNANKAFKTAGLSSNDYMQTVTSFSASLISGLGGDTKKAAEYADRAIRDMSDNANTFGYDMETMQAAYKNFAKGQYMMLDSLSLGYGGSKEEMERLIVDASKMQKEMDSLGVTVDANSMSFDNIINAISVMQTHLKISGTTAKEAAGTIEGSVNSMKAAWQNFLAGTIDPAEFAETAFQAADNVINAFGGILPRLADGFGQMTPKVLEKGGELIGKLVSTLQEKAPEFLQRGADFVEKLGAGLVSQIPQFLSNALPMVLKFTENLRSNAGKFVDSGINFIKNLVQGLANSLPTLLQYVPSIIINACGVINDNMPKILKAGLDIILILLKGIIQAVPTLIAEFPKIIQMIFSIIQAIDWMNLGRFVIDGISRGIASMGSSISSFLHNAGNNAWNAFRNIDWGNLGSQIINGIVRGLRNGADAIVSAAKNVAKQALNAAKAFLGIHSPSRVFQDEVGLQMDAGQAKGIIENADMVEDAAAEVAERALDASMDVNYNLPNTDSVSKDIGASFSSRVLNTVNRVIEVPLNLNGREIARATAWDMGEQLAWESR
jgi:phage-related protein